MIIKSTLLQRYIFKLLQISVNITLFVYWMRIYNPTLLLISVVLWFTSIYNNNAINIYTFHSTYWVTFVPENFDPFKRSELILI